MADVLKRLSGPMSLSTSSATLYTVPAATTAVIRNIHIASTVTTTTTFSMALNGSPLTTANSLFYTYSIVPLGVFDWSGMLVMTALDYLSCLASAVPGLTVTVSGVEVS